MSLNTLWIIVRSEVYNLTWGTNELHQRAKNWSGFSNYFVGQLLQKMGKDCCQYLYEWGVLLCTILYFAVSLVRLVMLKKHLATFLICKYINKNKEVSSEVPYSKHELVKSNRRLIIKNLYFLKFKNYFVHFTQKFYQFYSRKKH